MLNTIKVVGNGQVPLTIRKEAFKKYPAVWGCLRMMALKGATPDQVFHTMNKLLRVSMIRRKTGKMFATICREAVSSCSGTQIEGRNTEHADSEEGSGEDSEGDPEDPPDQLPDPGQLFLKPFPCKNNSTEGGFSVCS